MSLVLWFHVGNNGKLLLCNLSFGGNCRAKRKNDRLNFFTWQVSSGESYQALKNLHEGRRGRQWKETPCLHDRWKEGFSMNHPKPEVWMALPDLWLTPAAHPAVEWVAATAFQSHRKTSSEVPGERVCLEVRARGAGQAYLYCDQRISFSVLWMAYQSASRRIMYFLGDLFGICSTVLNSYIFESTLLHVCDGKYWATGTETRKGRTCLCVFPFPLEFRIVSSGIFLSFDIFKEGSRPVCFRQCIR